ncbi:hypothetical protein SAMD00019534_010870 [Acytostelium subglobosum LB1]|uniref:hypothetical protein n=1 Tax=Acytostelium subglobosum LB1 TaxID=1410327 RepID=UPI0006450F0D|nr:hypothetical protein SAMD00019534_010870 [Acytostelium subglobosum LB1]GAM17912.1 hypothetical protein SAMD00019534_010870 [Acytostelium subglobosum LB1]|eukprot:XP_012758508.1 hypothetical protein SAMD00019534_010870 [Acytostelium subglobosum LB1]
MASAATTPSSPPAAGNIQSEFEQLLEKLGITDPVKRKEMMGLPDASKRVLIDQNKTDIYKTVRTTKPSAAESFADVKSVILSINTKSTSIDAMRSLRVQLNTSPVDWIQSFLNNDGVQPILDILHSIEKKRKNKSKRKDLAILQYECIRCLDAIMKMKIGMEYIAKFPAATNQIMLAFDSDMTKLKTLILRLLAAAAILPLGHGAVLTSMIYYKEIRKEEQRYHTLVQSLKTETNREYIATCISFINCLISSPAEVSARIEIRKAFLNLKILKYFENLREQFNEDKAVTTQLDVFQEEMVNDEQLNASQTSKLSIEEIFSQISARVTGTPSQADLVSLMSHFQKMASSSLGLRVWKLYLNLSVQLEEELESHPEVDINTINLAFPEQKKSSSLFSFGKSKSPVTSPGLSSQQAVDKHKLRKDNEEKQKTIDHLLKQLNSFSGGQDITKWMLEREEKNKMIAHLMAQAKVTDGFAENEQLRKDLEATRLELNCLKSSPILLSSTPTMQMPNGRLSSGNTSSPATPDLAPNVGGDGSGIADSTSDPNEGGPPAPPGDGPPPPPPPPGGGPPPPPPPPGMGGPPPPPPPPGSKKGTPSRPAKPIIKPSVKMRNFNWVTMPVLKVENTLWDKMDESSIIQQLDTNELEALFSAKAPPPKAETLKSPKKMAITLIDPKKANNCAIMLQHFKLGNAELKRILSTMDEKMLDQQNATYLVQFVPTKEDIDILKEFGGDVSQLGAAEQFMMAIMDIPKLDAKLKSHLFKLKLPSMLEDMNPDIRAVKHASMEIKSSRRLHEILRFLLGVGNYINGSTTRGGAHGFKLDTLSKLRDARTNDGKMSLIHYLAKLIQEKNVDLWSFTSDLKHLEHAAEVSINNIQQDFNEIKRGIELIEKEFAAQVPGTGAPPSSQGAFEQSMIAFLRTAKDEYNKLDTQITEMNNHYETVTNYFGESKACPPDQFFSYFSDFFDDLEKAWKEYQNMLKAEKDAKYEDPEKGGLEDITTHIRSGKLFKDRRQSSNLTHAMAEKVQQAAASLKPAGASKNLQVPSPKQPQPVAPSQSLLKPSSLRTTTSSKDSKDKETPKDKK